MHLEIIIVVLVTVPICNLYAEGFSENEHRCYSRFDYEYKVVEKLFECETAHKKQKETIAELKDALEIVKRTSDNLQRDVDILKGSSPGGKLYIYPLMTTTQTDQKLEE